MHTTLRCKRCDDVIGVYEPMIVLDEGHARATARAAELDGTKLDGELYHPACWAQLTASSTAQES